MYSYIYDSFVSQKKYQKLLARVEIRLTDLGISGKIKRLSPLKNLKETIKDEIRGGAKTIVVVGDDSTLGEVINLVAGKNITLALFQLVKTIKLPKP